MSLYSLISSLFSYAFTTIIYVFIFSIIVLIYKDIKKVSKGLDEDVYDEEDYIDEEDDCSEDGDDPEEAEYTAILKTVISKESSKFNLRKRYRIGMGPIIIGRSEECDIVIPDIYLSQEHFKIYCKKGIWYIVDLKSKNGTYVNDVLVKGKQILDDYDEISFGDVRFIFQFE